VKQASPDTRFQPTRSLRIDLTASPLTLNELLDSARDESVVVRAADRRTYVLSAADDLSSEIESLRRNHQFLALLDALKEDRTRVPLEEAERRLR
jgi:hypothetical protein